MVSAETLYFLSMTARVCAQDACSKNGSERWPGG